MPTHLVGPGRRPPRPPRLILPTSAFIFAICDASDPAGDAGTRDAELHHARHNAADSRSHCHHARALSRPWQVRHPWMLPSRPAVKETQKYGHVINLRLNDGSRSILPLYVGEPRPPEWPLTPCASLTGASAGRAAAGPPGRGERFCRGLQGPARGPRDAASRPPIACISSCKFTLSRVAGNPRPRPAPHLAAPNARLASPAGDFECAALLKELNKRPSVRRSRRSRRWGFRNKSPPLVLVSLPGPRPLAPNPAAPARPAPLSIRGGAA